MHISRQTALWRQKPRQRQRRCVPFLRFRLLPRRPPRESFWHGHMENPLWIFGLYWKETECRWWNQRRAGNYSFPDCLHWGISPYAAISVKKGCDCFADAFYYWTEYEEDLRTAIFSRGLLYKQDGDSFGLQDEKRNPLSVSDILWLLLKDGYRCPFGYQNIIQENQTIKW